MLDGFVQRKDFEVIRTMLPPKKEYVLSVRLSPKQIELYQTYLARIPDVNVKRCFVDEQQRLITRLFGDFSQLSRIWSHPWILKLHERRLDVLEAKQAAKEANAGSLAKARAAVGKKTVGAAAAANENDSDSDELFAEAMGFNADEFDDQAYFARPVADRWWQELIEAECEHDIQMSGKLVLLDMLLKLSEKKTDKL